MRRCENCAASLDGRRRQTRFCGGACRAAASRTRAALRPSTPEPNPTVAREDKTARNRTPGAREQVVAQDTTAYADWPLASAAEEARLAAAIQKFPDLAREAA